MKAKPGVAKAPASLELISTDFLTRHGFNQVTDTQTFTRTYFVQGRAVTLSITQHQTEPYRWTVKLHSKHVTTLPEIRYERDVIKLWALYAEAELKEVARQEKQQQAELEIE